MRKLPESEFGDCHRLPRQSSTRPGSVYKSSSPGGKTAALTIEFQLLAPFGILEKFNQPNALDKTLHVRGRNLECSVASDRGY